MVAHNEEKFAIVREGFLEEPNYLSSVMDYHLLLDGTFSYAINPKLEIEDEA